ncbi:MAG: hypothetical protein AB1451_07360 [Nitrospirota bacterium]
MEAFSRDEVEFLKQEGPFAWKERLTQRIKTALEALHDALAARLTPDALLAPEEMDWTRWQLVRGERFGDRPYAYVDFPQHFFRDEKFTYRSMFWWGEGLFFALILEGNLLDRYRANLDKSYAAVADQELSLSLAQTPWVWRAAGPSVLAIQTDNRDSVISAARNRTVLKLQRWVSLNRLIEPDMIVREGVETFSRLLPVIARNS